MKSKDDIIICCDDVLGVSAQVLEVGGCRAASVRRHQGCLVLSGNSGKMHLRKGKTLHKQ